MIKGCTTSTACNYNSDAKEDDNSCIDPLGCDNWCPGDTTDVKELDCAGVCGGIQFIDCTGQCGILITDECGACGGNNSICKDCNGVINGSAYKDNCSICVGGDTGLGACTYDCTGYWGGDAELDACGVCEGTNIDDSQCTECPIGQALGCDNSCYPASIQPLSDECGVCGGDNTVCAGCDGVPNSGFALDVCGVCEGDGICLPEDCTDDNESGYCQDLSVLQILIDNSSGTLNMYMDENGDGVIEPLELGVQEWVNGRLTLFRCDLIKGDMDMCGLSGEIPESMSNLTNLTYLTLGGNELIGEIPKSIGNLINLTNLLLTGDQLTGQIPSEIGNLTNLTVLNLFDTQLTGEIPSEIGSLMNLTDLNLSYNQLTGSIPSEIGNLTNLTVLNLASNQLSGEIPSEIGNLDNLTYLSLAKNEISGDIPLEIGNLISLTSLNLYDNELTGEIPPEIGNLISLTSLNLHDNLLTGEIPEEIGNLISLTWLYLNNNQLTGQIPEEICNIGDSNPDLFNNNLCPPYPSCIEDYIGEQDTSECSETVTDIDGNNYETVQIGDQLWMAENLKVTHYNNGDEIQTGYADEEWTALETGAYAIYNDAPINADVYGNLYNWYAVDDARAVCPDGWHVPSDDEWKEMELYLGMCEGSIGLDNSNAFIESEGDVNGCIDNMGWIGTDEGSKLAGNSNLWNDGNLENNSEFGTSGFNGLPAGLRHGYMHQTGDTYNYLSSYGHFWSSSDYSIDSSTSYWYRKLLYTTTSVARSLANSQRGFSVRCLKD